MILEIDSNQDSLIEDRLYDTSPVDLLAREDFAKNIAHHISNTKNEKAFAISIIGRWGAGKSVFLKFIENELKLDENNEVFIFNPWKVSDVKLIISDFFQSIGEAISKYDKDAAVDIDKYSSYLTSVDNSTLTKIVINSIDIFSKDQSLDERYKRIDESIKSSGKRFIVFVDDVDRLTGDELIQILKLIRNTANFSNVFFIAALDYQYTVDTLQKTGKISSEKEYLQKIFQLEIVLPPIKPEFIKNKLFDLLLINKMSSDEKAEFESVLNHLSPDSIEIAQFFYPDSLLRGMLEESFASLRDVVRFVNSFKIRYRILKDEIDLYDLFLLELVKLKSPQIYTLLGDRKLIKFKTQTHPLKYIIDADALSKVLNEQDKTEMPLLKRLLEKLFEFDENYKTKRAIIYPDNYSIYFNYQLFNNISIKAFKRARELDLEKFYTVIRQWIAEGKRESVNQILSDIVVFKNASEFEKFITLFLYLADDNIGWVRTVRDMLRQENDIVSLYYKDSPDKLGAFIKSIFSNPNISNFVKVELSSNFTREAFETGNTPYFEQNEWQVFAYNAFEMHKESNPEIKNIDFDFYIKNWQSRDENRRIIIYPPASKLFMKFIEKDKVAYLKRAFRPYYQPPGDIYTFDPFISSIFGSQENFEVFLNATISNDKYIDLVKHYYTKYKENGFEEFHVEDPLHLKIIEQEIKKLD